MKKTTLLSLTLAGLLASGAANAQFFGTLGYTQVNPSSGNGTLAGADANVNSDGSLTGSLGYKFTPNMFVELGTALAPFEHEVTLDGLGTVASLKHRPTVLSLNYQFNADATVRPFVRVGYGWIGISDETTRGALAGLDISADDASGLAFGAGIDFFVAERVFIRADVSRLDFDSDVTVETLGNVGTAEVDPLVYGVALGYQF